MGLPKKDSPGFRIIHPGPLPAKDNVAVALRALDAGTEVTTADGVVRLLEPIPPAHKFAVVPIACGERVVKYGYPIGCATRAIAAGARVDERNLQTGLSGIQQYRYAPSGGTEERSAQTITFRGYRRANGEIGIRNGLWIVPAVGCVNGVGDQLMAALKSGVGDWKLDEALVLRHGHGCSQLGEDHENTRKILRDLVLHPNAGAVLVLGLGCENNRMESFREFLGDYDQSRVKFLVAQSVPDEHREGLSLLRELYARAVQDKRETVPLSGLKIGLKCGGSDGMSGITANPLLGALTDMLIAQGATAVLTEVPEMFGAETILMNRAENQLVYDRIVALINGYKRHFLENNHPVYQNPSPGNRAGGITTLEEKSLGCIRKAGNAIVRDVLEYGERLTRRGLNLLSAPGNDLVSSTALGAAGCQMILFTTGRGTPFGTFVPTVKISSNTPLAGNKPHWIDFDAGVLAAPDRSTAEVAERLLALILEVAEGKYVNNEINGGSEIAMLKTGITL